MTLSNVSLIDNSITEFNNLSIDAQVNFSLGKGNRTYNLGVGDRGYSVRERPFCLTKFDITFTGLCKAEVDELRVIIDTLKVGVKFFPFNDFSDNYMFPWEVNGLRQTGIVLPILGQTDKFRLCKRYSVGKLFSYRPIYYFPPESEVEINGGSTNGILDKTTGIVTSTEDITGVNFETDLYYTLVRIEGDFEVFHYYSEGFNALLDLNYPETDKQLFSVKLQLKEVRINEVLGYESMLPDSELLDLTELDLCELQNDLIISDKTFFNRFEHNEFVAQENNPASQKVRTVTIPARTVKHRQLIYWLTAFKGCSGTSFNIIPTVV